MATPRRFTASDPQRRLLLHPPLGLLPRPSSIAAAAPSSDRACRISGTRSRRPSAREFGHNLWRDEQAYTRGASFLGRQSYQCCPRELAADEERIDRTDLPAVSAAAGTTGLEGDKRRCQ